MISFVETKLFTRLVQEYLSDDEYSQLQKALIADPEAGSVIPGSGGSAIALGHSRARQTRRSPGHLLPADSAWSDLDADAVSEERSGEHPGARSQPDQG